MIQCVKNAVEHVGISLEEALRMASTYPSRLLSDDTKLGRIETGYNASFVVFDNNLDIKKVVK